MMSSCDFEYETFSHWLEQEGIQPTDFNEGQMQNQIPEESVGDPVVNDVEKHEEPEQHFAPSPVMAVANDSLPTIKIGVDIARMARNAEAALANDPQSYQRAGSLVFVTRSSNDETIAKRSPLPADSPMIRYMTKPILRARLSEVVRWEKLERVSKSRGAQVEQSAQEWIPTRPDEDTCAALFDQGSWKGVRQLVGICTAPTIRSDGSILQQRGYDAATGYMFLPDRVFPEISQSSTKEEACAALARLQDVFCDFPFSDPSGLSAVIAAIISVAARPAIDGSLPMLVTDASTRGSGKTKLCDVISIIATGKPVPKLAYPASDDELRKSLDGYAMLGTPVICYDNANRTIGGAALESFATSNGNVSIRILGSTGQHFVPWRSLVTATGNNVSLTDDAARRTMIARLEPTVEKPEDRKDFRYPNLEAYVTEHRAELLVDALTVLKAYFVAGKPDMETGVWGSFEAFSALIPQAIVFAGGANCMLSKASNEESGTNPESEALSAILEGLATLDKSGKGLTARDIVSHLYPGGRRPEPDGPPDGFEALRDAIEYATKCRPGFAPEAKDVGEIFRARRGRIIGGRKLTQGTLLRGSARWISDTTI